MSAGTLGDNDPGFYYTHDVRLQQWQIRWTYPWDDSSDTPGDGTMDFMLVVDESQGAAAPKVSGGFRLKVVGEPKDGQCRTIRWRVNDKPWQPLHETLGYSAGAHGPVYDDQVSLDLDTIKAFSQSRVEYQLCSLHGTLERGFFQTMQIVIDSRGTLPQPQPQPGEIPDVLLKALPDQN
jgi:hypothetical protein